MLLLITSACCGINILPNIFGLLGMNISALGIISKCDLNGGIAFIVFIVLSVAYNLYVAAFSLHSFKNGNAFLGIILALFFVWNVAGSFITTIVQNLMEILVQYTKIDQISVKIFHIIHWSYCLHLALLTNGKMRFQKAQCF